MRYFNTEGACRPDEHYMVRLDNRLAAIKNTLIAVKSILSSTRGGSMGRQQR